VESEALEGMPSHEEKPGSDRAPTKEE